MSTRFEKDINCGRCTRLKKGIDSGGRCTRLRKEVTMLLYALLARVKKGLNLVGGALEWKGIDSGRCSRLKKYWLWWEMHLIEKGLTLLGDALDWERIDSAVICTIVKKGLTLVEYSLDLKRIDSDRRCTRLKRIDSAVKCTKVEKGLTLVGDALHWKTDWLL